MAGNKAIDFNTEDFLGENVNLKSYMGNRLLLSFFRDASCPFCNLRLNQLIKRYDDFQDKGIAVITLFASSRDTILKYAGKQEPPFPIVPDEELKLYKLYKVEESISAKLRTMAKIKDVMKVMRSEYFNFHSFGTENIVPADFMVNENLVIDRAYYGKDFGDHIPIEEILSWDMR